MIPFDIEIAYYLHLPELRRESLMYVRLELRTLSVEVICLKKKENFQRNQ